MDDILKQEFKTTPGGTERHQYWLNENKDKIQVIGEYRRPYRTHTRKGPSIPTSVEIISVFYKEK